MSGIWGTKEEQAYFIVEQQNPYLTDPRKGLELLAKLIAKPEKQEEVALKLEKLHHELHGRFLHLCSREQTPNEAELFLQLHKAFKDLEELAGFHALANKNVVAVGGSFSAGKSRFINSLLGDSNLLPWDTKKTTAIPTHVLKGDAETIRAINTLNSIIDLDRDAFKAICHDFHRVHNVGFSHLIKLITIEIPIFPYDNITLLDTPGYSASDGIARGDNTDETIAREHLSQADHLIWVVSAAADGGISHTDIEFIQSLKNMHGAAPEIFLLMNKADILPSVDDVQQVTNAVLNALASAHIRCVGTAAFNSLKGVQVFGDSIAEYLAAIDRKTKPTMMAKRFSTVFDAFARHNFEEQQQAQQLFGFLQKVQLRLAESLSGDEKAEGNRLREAARRKSEELKAVLTDFSALAEKIDGMVQGVMQEIKEVREVGDDLPGIKCGGTVKDANRMVTLNDGEILRGTVKHADPWGIFIDFRLGEDVRIFPDEVKKCFSGDPKKLFTVGVACTAQVISVNRGSQQVKLVVMPDLE